MGNTVRVHRVLRSTPEKVWRAFVEPDAYASWLPPFGFLAQVHEMDVREGGAFRMTFTNFGAKASHSFGGTFLEVVPMKRLRCTDTFEDPKLPGTMVTTVSIRPVAVGVDLEVVQENVPESIPVEFCYAGWQESLVRLGQLVEPDIPAES